MYYQALSKAIADGFPSLSPQLQVAALMVLDRPDDVTLISVRGLAISVQSYTRETVAAAEFVHSCGGLTVVVTDNLVSPLSRNADRILLIETEGPSFFTPRPPHVYDGGAGGVNVSNRWMPGS